MVGVGVIQGVRQFTDISLQALLFTLAGVLVVFAVVLLLIPEKKDTVPDAKPGSTSGAKGKSTAEETEPSPVGVTPPTGGRPCHATGVQP